MSRDRRAISSSFEQEVVWVQCKRCIFNKKWRILNKILVFYLFDLQEVGTFDKGQSSDRKMGPIKIRDLSLENQRISSQVIQLEYIAARISY